MASTVISVEKAGYDSVLLNSDCAVLCNSGPEIMVMRYGDGILGLIAPGETISFEPNRRKRNWSVNWRQALIYSAMSASGWLIYWAVWR